MSNRDLQRLTNSVDNIVHGPSQRRVLRTRRNHITQKVLIAGQRTLCLNVHDDVRPSPMRDMHFWEDFAV